jgi:hypothetical protein
MMRLPCAQRDCSGLLRLADGDDDDDEEEEEEEYD